MDIKETPDHIGNDVFDVIQIEEGLIHSADSYIVSIYFAIILLIEKSESLFSVLVILYKLQFLLSITIQSLLIQLCCQTNEKMHNLHFS